MPALYLIPGAAALIALILLLRIRLDVRYDADFSASLRVLFVKIPLAPRKKAGGSDARKGRSSKKQSSAKADGREKEPSAWKKMTQQYGVSGAVGVLAETARMALGRFGRLLSHVRVKGFTLRLTVASPDAAQTAVEYGAVCGVLYPLLGLLAGRMRFSGYRVDVRPDFDGGESGAFLSARLYVRVLFLAAAAFSLLFGYLKNVYSRAGRELAPTRRGG